MKQFLLLIITIVLLGCNSEKGKRTWTDDDEVDSTEASISSPLSEPEDEDYDSSEAMEKTGNAITDLKNHVEEVNSPDKLMEYQEVYKNELATIEYRLSKSTDSEERSKLESNLNEIKLDFDNKINEYSMPANGIIQNIQNLKERLNKCYTSKEFNNIVDPRYSYFKNLPKIHNIVAEKNRQSEVREQASELYAIFMQKANEYGIDIR